MPFNLITKSEYSFMQSNIKIDDIISFTLRNNFLYASLIDDSLYGAYDFVYKCKINHIKPILGLNKIFIYQDSLCPLILIAMSERGYYNLVSINNIVSSAPISISDISMYLKDIALVIDSSNSLFSELIDQNDFFKASELIDYLKGYFKNIYLGVYSYLGVDKNKLATIKDFFKSKDIEIIASQHSCHKINKDSYVIELLRSIKTSTPFDLHYKNNSYINEAYLKDYSSLSMCYSQDELKALDNFADLISIDIKKLPLKLPSLYENSDEKLYELACNRLNELELDDSYKARVDYEFEIIKSLHFSNYFLIVADYVNYAKSIGIPVGPSRGSGGSSLIAYLLNITSIDPLKYDLLFERFLNPSRANFPDFDIDFGDIRREEVIRYCQEKYGINSVVHIGTFQTYGVKQALLDAASSLKMRSTDLEYLQSFIPKNTSSLIDLYKENQQFKNVIDIHENYKQLISFASSLVSLIRQSGTHASGIIIYDDDLTHLIPLSYDNGIYITQYEYSQCEALNLIKIDFLGLKNLTLIDHILKHIDSNYTINNYNYDDLKGYELISKNKTIGLFQLESSGMNRVISKFKIDSFMDLVSLISIYRPGPLDNIDDFIYGKNHVEEIKYLDPRLEQILKPTYGIIIYQEQIMQILVTLGNYSMQEADVVRKAISKKDDITLKNEREKFLSKTDLDSKKASYLFDLIYKFASYGFNKAHAVGYGVISSISASLKANYPTLFYYYLLSDFKASGKELKSIINEAKSLNVNFKYPSIISSSSYYEIAGNDIIFGLTNIKDISESVAQIIMKERNIDTFNDFIDFVIRMCINNVSQMAIENLIYAGACDCFNISRDILINNLPNYYNSALMFKGLNYIPNSYDKDYSFISMPIMNNERTINEEAILKKEYDMLSVYLHDHPLTIIKKKLNKIYTLIQDYELGKSYLSLVSLISFKKNTYKDATGIVVDLEDESMRIHATSYINVDNLLKEISGPGVYEVEIKYDKFKYYLNSIRKVD